MPAFTSTAHLRIRVALYSDLLLHDMGSLADGEAAIACDRHLALPPDGQRQLRVFLQTL